MYSIHREDFSSKEMMKKLVDLQNRVYFGKRIFTDKTFKHWYLDNPNGKVVSFNAFYEDVIVAHYALVPMKMLIEGKVVDGLLSMATVTDPAHQGKGLFKQLAKETFNYATEVGYKFVIGVANANSYPGFIKYFDFQDIGKLDVMLGFSNKITAKGDKKFSIYWTNEALKWRIRENYRKDYNNVYGTVGFGPFKTLFGVKTFMGNFSSDILKTIGLEKNQNLLRPLNLYIGLGSNAKSKGYFRLPKFIKRSPFHLIFLDLTNGDLPKVDKENIFFQLIDFDVV